MAFATIKKNKLVRAAVLPFVEKRRLKRNISHAERLEVPETIQIEPTAACNLKCVMCFREKSRFDPRLMDMALYKKIIDQAAGSGVRRLRLYFRGEPLLHPEIADMAEYAVQKGIPCVEINTNGQLLNRRLSERLIRSGIHKVLFSVEGFNKKDYEAVRKGANFEKLIENIEGFNEARGNYPDSALRTTLITVNIGNDGLLGERFRKFWQPYVDEIMVVGMVSHGGLDVPGLDSRRDKRPITRPCIQLWDRMLIFSDGTVPLCCSDINGGYRLGNASEQSLMEIRRSEALIKFRKLHRSGRRNTIRLCSTCNFMMP